MPQNWTHILLIDDDPIYGDFVRSSILDANLNVTVGYVGTLDTALAYLRGEAPFGDRTAHPLPGIILLDLKLAQQRGFPVLEFLRENGYLENDRVRVIVLTASDREEDMHEAMQLGAASFLVKTPVASTITNLVSKYVVAA